jgi:hypothetical protein
MRKHLKAAFTAIVIAGSGFTGMATAYPGASGGSNSTSTGGSYTSSGSFVSAPDHGDTEVRIGDVSVRCTNSTSISFGVVGSDTRYNDPNNPLYEDNDSLRIGVTVSHILGTSTKECESMSRLARQKAEMSMRANWMNTVRDTCRQDIAKQASNIEVLDYYKTLTETLYGYEDIHKAANAADMCFTIRKKDNVAPG